jgi:hypothetical protein
VGGGGGWGGGGGGGRFFFHRYPPYLSHIHESNLHLWTLVCFLKIDPSLLFNFDISFFLMYYRSEWDEVNPLVIKHSVDTDLGNVSNELDLSKIESGFARFIEMDRLMLQSN